MPYQAVLQAALLWCQIAPGLNASTPCFHFLAAGGPVLPLDISFQTDVYKLVYILQDAILKDALTREYIFSASTTMKNK